MHKKVKEYMILS